MANSEDSDQTAPSGTVWSGSALFAYVILSETVVFKILRHLLYPKYSVLGHLSTYHTSPKIWNSLFYYLFMCLKYCWMYGKQCRPWSGSTKAYLSQYLGLLQ